jgi:PAS domain-containing protein
MTDSSDVTEQTPSHPLLDDTEQRYGGFFARLNVAVLLIDPTDGSLVDANAAAREHYEQLWTRAATGRFALSSRALAAT